VPEMAWLHDLQTSPLPAYSAVANCGVGLAGGKPISRERNTAATSLKEKFGKEVSEEPAAIGEGYSNGRTGKIVQLSERVMTSS
jgi:hypothetical protein